MVDGELRGREGRKKEGQPTAGVAVASLLLPPSLRQMLAPVHESITTDRLRKRE